MRGIGGVRVEGIDGGVEEKGGGMVGEYVGVGEEVVEGFVIEEMEMKGEGWGGKGGSLKLKC